MNLMKIMMGEEPTLDEIKTVYAKKHANDDLRRAVADGNVSTIFTAATSAFALRAGFVETGMNIAMLWLLVRHLLKDTETCTLEFTKEEIIEALGGGKFRMSTSRKFTEDGIALIFTHETAPKDSQLPHDLKAMLSCPDCDDDAPPAPPPDAAAPASDAEPQGDAPPAAEPAPAEPDATASAGGC